MSNADMLHKVQLKSAGFVQEGDYNFIKGDFVVEMYRNTIFVYQVFNDYGERTSYRIPLISTNKGFESYKYKDIPLNKVVEWLCNDLTKLEMYVENYLLSKSLEALD